MGLGTETPPEGTWYQAARQEETSYRDPPCTEWQTGVKAFPCPRLRLLAVKMWDGFWEPMADPHPADSQTRHPPCKMTIGPRRTRTFCVSVPGPIFCGRRVLHLLLHPEVPPTNFTHYTQVFCYLCSFHGNVRCVFVVWRLVKYLHVAKC